MKNIRNQLDKYAELAIKTGVNLQEGQTLVIKAPITAADFVRVVVKTAYETGAGHVHVEWEDDQLLVQHHSPISGMDIVFYDTLYDENASVHLAIGNAYPICMEGGTQMSSEELVKNGANVSTAHADFMIGGPEMEIDGELSDGSREPLFQNGN